VNFSHDKSPANITETDSISLNVLEQQFGYLNSSGIRGSYAVELGGEREIAAGMSPRNVKIIKT
jgi:hypothetical protein